MEGILKPSKMHRESDYDCSFYYNILKQRLFDELPRFQLLKYVEC